MTGQRVCLFGGTFDPIHNAHIKMAEEAARRFHLDRIVFIPAGNPPHKDSGSVTPYAARLQMVKLACAGNPRFVVSEVESTGDRSYTVNTLSRFREQLSAGDSLFFLIGADAFDELETWHRWEDVVQLTDFIVVSRPGKTYHVPEGARVLRLDEVQLPTASTVIRAKLAAGEPTPEVPPAVRDYIETHGLYRSTESSLI
jgi:nicotinate-nucleotide adenylyltransferase